MNKESIISKIAKVSFTVLLLMSGFIIFLFGYIYYNNYSKSLKLLEDKTIKNHKNLIVKINDNIVTRYAIQRKSSFTNKKNQIKHRVFLAYSLLQNIYYAKKGKLSSEKMKNYSLNLLNFIRFDNGVGYYNVFDVNGNPILNSDNEQNKITPFFKHILQTIKNGKEKFFIITWKHPFKKNIDYSKMIYGMYFDKFQWIIITGFYIEDFQKKFDRQFLKEIKELKIPSNMGLIIINKKNKAILRMNQKFPLFLSEIKDTDFKNNNFFKLFINNMHFTLFKNEIFFNKWKIYTFFVNEKVKAQFEETKKILFTSFVLHILLILFLTLLVFVFLFFYMKNFRKKLSEQFNVFIKFIKEVPKTYEKISPDKIEYLEIDEIARQTNEMVDTIKKLNIEKDKIHNEILKEKQFLNTILENLQQGIAVINFDYSLEYANTFALELIGADNYTGINLLEITKKYLNENDIVFPKLMQEIRKNKKAIKLEKVKFFRLDGSLRYIYLAMAPILDNSRQNVEKVVALFFDITEEEKLKKEILKLQRAVENAPISIIITDSKFHIEYVNPYFEKTMGFSLTELTGEKPSIFGTEYNKRFYKDIISQITSGRTWKGEFLNKKKNGESLWELAYIAPIINKKGSIINYVAVKEDITERKNFIKQLEIAKEKAEIASKAKSEFLANMSHEIRTPMNAIMGFVDLVLESDLKDTQRKYLEIVKQSTDNLLRILNDILDISKFDSSKMEFEEKPFNLVKLINACSNTFSYRISTKGLNFKLEIDENIPETFIGDEVRIAQVINNLLNNAIKFTDKGEISIKVYLQSKTDKHAIIKISVADTGVGIPQDKKDKIFEAFTQADGSITRRFGGTGLGLTIASKVVKHYNGKIWVESEEGKGSVFHFTLHLPISDTKMEEEQYDGSEQIRFKSKVNILVAEDIETNQILIKNILESMGAEVTVAENGLRAIHALAEKEFHLILMDWHMPEMDGAQALKILRDLEAGKKTENKKIKKDVIQKLEGKKFIVVALTAAALKKEKDSLLAMGFDGYISKPIKRDELNIILKKFLNDKIQITNEKFIVKSEHYEYIKQLVGDDEELIEKLINSFKDTYNVCVQGLEKAIKDHNFNEIYKHAHTLKGAAANLGFKEIAELALKIENFTKTENIDYIKNSFNLLLNKKPFKD